MYIGAQLVPKPELTQRKAGLLGGVVAVTLGFWPAFTMSPTHQKILGSFNLGLTSIAGMVVMASMLKSTGMFDTAKTCWRRQEADANAAFEHEVRTARELESSCAAAERNEQLHPDDATSKAIATAARKLLKHGREAQARARASTWSVYACRWEHIATCLVEGIEHLTLAELAARLEVIEAERQKSARLIQSWRGEAAAIDEEAAEELTKVEGLRSKYFIDAVNLVLAQRIHTAVSGGSTTDARVSTPGPGRADLETLREHLAAGEAWREVVTGTQEPTSEGSGRPVTRTDVAGVEWNDAFDWAGLDALSPAPDPVSPSPVATDDTRPVEPEPPNTPAATRSPSPELQAFVDAFRDLYLEDYADRLRSLFARGAHLQPPFRNWHLFTSSERLAFMRGVAETAREMAVDPDFADQLDHCQEILTLAEAYIDDAPARLAANQLDLPHLNVFADIIEALPTPADFAALCQAFQAPQVGAVPHRFRELYSRWHALSSDGRVRLVRFIQETVAERATPDLDVVASAGMTRALASLAMLEAHVICLEELDYGPSYRQGCAGEATGKGESRNPSRAAEGHPAGESRLNSRMG
jgi:hypothetical protein